MFPFNISGKKIGIYPVLVAIAAVFLVFGRAWADDGPTIKNLNPQGLVTSQSVQITLDTDDLAYCRYSTSDTSYGNMTKMETSDGLYHSVLLGTLNKGSYTYYVRCQDFEGNSNSSSQVVKFTVGDVTCVGDNCDNNNNNNNNNNNTAGGPKLSRLLPSGTLYSAAGVTLSVVTDVAAVCRYSWSDKDFDSMTLPMASSDGLNHSAAAVLSKYGYYTYYVRCRDGSGNVNQVAGKIIFHYATTYVAPPPTPADTTPPTISNLAPSGDINTATVTISCSTNEVSICKYGTTDGDYDSLTDTMDTAGGLNHSKDITLTDAGQYTYYVRCKDAKGNKDTTSNQIGFNYVAPVKDGPVISDLQPTGAIYQKNVALIVTTDKPADCRYATTDVDFDAMQDVFSTSDGLLQQATVSLNDYGPYAYYVRCRDKDGNKDTSSQVINFEYKNPAADQINNPAAAPTTTSPAAVACTKIEVGKKDGVCDNTQDCLCDPDCPVAPDTNADPDCANVVATGSNNSWVAVVVIGLLLLIVAVVVIVIIRKRGGDEEDVELP